MELAEAAWREAQAAERDAYKARMRPADFAALGVGARPRGRKQAPRPPAKPENLSGGGLRVSPAPPRAPEWDETARVVSATFCWSRSEPPEPGFPAQVIASGPTGRYSAAPEMFEAVMYGARRELFITTPYYVPVDSMQSALCAAANRGVDTTIIFPARNDDFAVGATSRSYYADLLEAGVKIHEYGAGLLHTKSMTVDGEVTLIGSANMDRRSFDLNYENNILLCDPAATAEMRARQEWYLADCRQITIEEVAAWGWRKRLWNNALAIVGPLL